MISTIVWGDGGVAVDAIRAVDAHPALTLTAVLTARADRVGRDAGEVAGLGRALGVVVTDDVAAVFAARPRAVVFVPSGSSRSVDVRARVAAAVRTGAVVVTTPLYPLYDHRDPKKPVHQDVLDAVRDGGGSVHIGETDPDWVAHVLPLALRCIDGGATALRVTETVDYSGHDLPGSIRYLLGMGEPLSYLPPMLAPRMPSTVWGDRVRLLARALGVDLDELREEVDRVELEVSVETETMGKFEAGGMGAVRVEVRGEVDGEPIVVVEHIGRIHPDVAPDWPVSPPSGLGYTVVADGDPRVAVIVEPGPRIGDEAAVAGLVGVVERIVDLPPGVYDELLRP